MHVAWVGRRCVVVAAAVVTVAVVVRARARPVPAEVVAGQRVPVEAPLGELLRRVGVPLQGERTSVRVPAVVVEDRPRALRRGVAAAVLGEAVRVGGWGGGEFLSAPQ